MIIPQQKTNIVLDNSVQNFELSIKNEAIGKLVSLLSTSLYHNPLKAFVRETVSNAYDSHLEAGQTEKPIVVNYDRVNDTLSIRDYGVGLSPERIREVYSFVGGSTKSDTNEQIGGFGIGRLSGLALSDIVHITSWYDGIQYSYVLSKSDSGITLTLAHKILAPDSHNGVEVKVVIPLRWNYRYEIDDVLRHFPNVYYNESSNCEIFDFENFQVTERDYDSKILLGGVIPYGYSYQMGYSAIKGVHHKIPIGEVDLTTSREDLLFSDRTTKAIKDAIGRTSREIKKMITSKIGKTVNLSNLKEFLRILEYGFEGVKIDSMYNWLDCTFETDSGEEFSVKELKDFLCIDPICFYEIRGPRVVKCERIYLSDLYCRTSFLYDISAYTQTQNRVIKHNNNYKRFINTGHLREACKTPLLKLIFEYMLENFKKIELKDSDADEILFGEKLSTGATVQMVKQPSEEIILVNDRAHRKLVKMKDSRNVYYVNKTTMTKLKQGSNKYLSLSEFFNKYSKELGIQMKYNSLIPPKYFAINKIMEPSKELSKYYDMYSKYSWAVDFNSKFEIEPVSVPELDKFVELYELSHGFNLQTEIGAKLFKEYVNNK